MTTQAHGTAAGLPRSVRSIHWIGLTLLLLALVAAVPLWTGPGLVNTRGGGDSPFLFFRLQQLVTNLRDGVFPARWMPDAAYGLGYPFFNYYAALPYYFAAIFNLIGFDLLVSIKIVQTLGFVFAGLAMYRWANRHFPIRWAAWLAAVAYVYAPFHFVNVYVRGDSLSEFYAFIFYPLILLAIDRVIESPRSFGSLALAYGGLILTHNVSALIFSPFALIYAFMQLSRSNLSHRRTKILRLVFGFLLGLALSAWFWLPALGEANLVQLDNQTTGYFNYTGHFRSTDLVQPSIGFDYSINAAPGSNTPFAMGLLQALGTLGGLVAIVVTWKRDSHQSMRVFALIGLALSTVMITPLSRPLWDTLPLLSLTQFPWRFLSIQAFFTSSVIGYIGVLPATELNARRSKLVSGSIGLALVAVMLLPLHPEYLPIRADEITPLNLQLYEAFTGNIGTTIRAEYLPRTTIPRPYTGWAAFNLYNIPPPPIVSEGEATTNTALVSTSSTRQTWQVVVASDKATIDFPLLYWPGWTASIDGQPVEVRPAPDLGYIQIDVLRGEHHIEFSLGRTPIRVVGETVSLAALVMLVILFGARMRTRLRHTSVKAQFTSIRMNSLKVLPVLIVTIVAIGLAIAAQSIYAVPDGVDDLTMGFADMPWLHHNPGGVDFGSAQLLWYERLGETPDWISIGLNWKVTTHADITATLALVAPASHLFGGPGPITQLEIPVRSGYAQYILHSPYQLPFGTYYVRVQVGERVEYLFPIWVTERDQSVPLSVFGKLTSSIGLASAQAQHIDPEHLDILLGWSVSGVIDANYGISLRLRDSSGKQWTSLDTQPGYGFQPTSAWQIGTLNDAYTLSLPNDLPRAETYSLDVILYRVASKQEVGRASIDGIRLDDLYAWKNVEPPARVFTAPTLSHHLDAAFGDQIRLLGYELTRKGNTLTLTPAWKALTNISANYKVFVHVFDPATEKIVAQFDAMPHNNAYPTSRWLNGEVVTDTIAISLADVPIGSYRIALGLYLPPSDRLPVSGQKDVDRVILAEAVDVP